MVASTVPLTISPEAAARVAELRMQRELEQMLEHTHRSVPGLRSLRVMLERDWDGDDPGVIIEATMDDPHLADDPTEREWGAWKVTTFPPEVCWHFTMLTVYGLDHEG
jgi:hypothetical protein